MNLSLELNSLSILFILLSLIVLAVAFYLRGNYNGIKTPAPSGGKQLARALEAEKVHLTFKDFVRVNPILVGTLVVILPGLIGGTMFVLSGEDVNDYDIIGPWGLTAALIAVLGFAFGMIWLRKVTK